MKKLLILLVVLSTSYAYAGNRHYYPAKQGGSQKKALTKSVKMPGYCEIEIINPSSFPVHVAGQYLDGEFLQSFDIYPRQPAQYVELYYLGCMPGMNLSIVGFDGYVYLDGYVAVNSTVVIPNRVMGKAAKATVKHK